MPMLRVNRARQTGLLAGLLLLVAQSTWALSHELSSPDGRVKLQINQQQDLTYQLTVDNQLVVKPSAIAMAFTDGVRFDGRAVLVDSRRTSYKAVVTPEVAVRSSKIPEQYNQLTLSFKPGFSLTFRAYNQGIAYRFEGHLSDNATLLNEDSNFNFAAGTFAFFPFEKNFRTATQPTFTPLPSKSIDGDELGSLPALFVAQGINLLITESDLQDYPGMWLKGRGDGSLYGVHPRNLNEAGQFTEEIATIARKRSYPWRIIGVARNDAELLDIQLPYLLAEPSRLKDSSWIKPGKIAWDWYNENNLKGVDFRAGINTATYKYYADFAAQFGIESILIDDGWSTHEDVMTLLPGIDVPDIVDYAKSKGVSVQLWVPWSGLDKQMDQAMALYKGWGITGLKVDFMNSDSQSMVNFYWRTAEMAAKHELMINFHGSYKPAGLHRTYPNVLTREGVKGLENHKWSDAITPTHNLHLPFIRMIAGPMDYTPGAMANAHRKNFNAVFSRPMSLGTRAHQVAMFVLYESPLQMLADTPSSYQAEPAIPEFIAAIPTVWDDYRVLHASIGEYLVMARRKGDKWYIGAMTNEQPRSFILELDFVDSGRYQMNSLADGINADKHAEDFRLDSQLVEKGQRIKIELAGGGGWTGILTPD